MFELYISNRQLSSFQGGTLQEVCSDYVSYCIDESCNPAIERIEQIDENDKIIKIILGSAIQDDLDEEINKITKELGGL